MHTMPWTIISMTYVLASSYILTSSAINVVISMQIHNIVNNTPASDTFKCSSSLYDTLIAFTVNPSTSVDNNATDIGYNTQITTSIVA